MAGVLQFLPQGDLTMNSINQYIPLNKTTETDNTSAKKDYNTNNLDIDKPIETCELPLTLTIDDIAKALLILPVRLLLLHGIISSLFICI